MTAVPVAQRMRAEEFLALPVPDHGRPHNLVAGEVVVNEPTPLHMRVQEDLFYALSHWSRAEPGRGRVCLPRDVRLDDHNVFASDILWYSDGRVPDVHSQPRSPMPDLAVEVRSPSTWRFDVGVKRTAYEQHGLPELWLVDTSAGAVLVFRRSAPGARSFDVALEVAGGRRLESPLLPGFSIAMSGLFPG